MLASLVSGLALVTPAVAQTNAYALLQQQSSKLSGSGSGSTAGTSVAISADGSTAVVGIPGDNGGAGGAQVYVWNPTNGNWNVQGSELANGSAAGLGNAVAISGDGNTVLVGSSLDNGAKGAVLVFTRSAGVWSQRGGKLVGSGGTASDLQGHSVALSADGNTAVVGAPNYTGNVGRFWVFARSAGSWSELGSATPADEAGPGGPQAAFGYSVAVSANGKTAIIGGPQDNTGLGAAWVYSIGTSTVTETVKLAGRGGTPFGNQGSSVALSGDGTTAVIGASFDNSFVGDAFVFSLVSGNWTQQAMLSPSDSGAGSLVGTSAAVSRDGSDILLGGSSDNGIGAVWMFARTGLSAWTQQGTKMVPSDATSSAAVGSAVSLSADGNSAFIGASMDNSAAGAAWPFNTNVAFPPTATSSTVTQNISIQMANSYTLGNIAVVTQGSINLDFVTGSQPGSGACQIPQTFSSGSNTCTFAVQFQPTAPGLRLGAILFYDDSNVLQATVFLNGIGLAPQLSFLNRSIDTVAGTGQTPGFSGDGMAPASAELDFPFGTAFDGAGDYFIADYGNHRVRGVNTDDATSLYTVSVSPGTIQTVAGDGTSGSSGNSVPALSGEFIGPQAPTIDGAGNLYVADVSANLIRKVDATTGFITTFAGGGPGGLNGPATSAAFVRPAAVAAGRNGDIYIGSLGNNAVYRVSAETGIITTLAGSGVQGFSGDGGPATSAKFFGPLALAIDPSENAYVSDDGNNVIREVLYGTETISTVAGTPGTKGGYSGDGEAATLAELCDSEGLALDPAGDLYIADSSNNVVREVFASTGIIQTIAGSTAGASGFNGDMGGALSALLNYPGYPVIDATGNVWFSDNDNHVVRELSGGATLNFGDVNLNASSAAQDVTVTNTGTDTINITGLTINGGFNANGPDTTCNGATALLPGQSCVLGMEFSPTITGPVTRFINIASNAPGMQGFFANGNGVNLTSTTTSLTALPNPANVGDSVTFSASVLPIPDAGSVNFLDGSTSLGSVNVDSNGDAVFMTSSLTLGSHTITAQYGGDSLFGSSTSVPVTEDINAPSPALISISPTSATVGSGGFTLTLTGTNFASNSVANWNGTALVATFVNATSLMATVPGSDIATAGTASVTVTTPAPGGGTSSAQTFTVNNPAPTITSLFPTFRIFGGAGFQLSVTGTNFVSGSVVNWNGTALTTTFVSATSVTAAVPASDIAATGTVPITVVNPAPGGGTSSSVNFLIDNPAPGFLSASPTSATAGDPDFTITITGFSFVSGTVVTWNGVALTTTFVSDTSLTATVPASDVAAAGTTNVRVRSPGPGGGSSDGGATFTINNPAPTLTTIAPNSATAGGSTFMLTLTGTNFVSTSVVNWNGSALVTTFVSATSLTATVPATDIASGGSASVTVFNPAPGGGTSSSRSFTIHNILAPTQTMVAPQSNPVTLGDTALFTVIVSPTSSGGTPTGLVTLFDGTTPIESATLSGGLAFVRTANLSAADSPHSITVRYQGDSNFSGSAASPLSFTVNPRTSTTGVALNPTTAVVGQPSTATVTLTDSGSVPPGTADTFATTGAPATGRTGFTSTLFADGLVLVAGGANSGGTVLASAQIYSVSGGTFSATGNLSAARTGASAVLLPNGRVLIAGGSSDGTANGALNTAELFDPTAGTFTNTTNNMTAARFGATATYLTTGLVLLAGGENSGGVLNSSELYDPMTDTFTATGNLNTARTGASATILGFLPAEKVLIAGGSSDGTANGALNSAELFDPNGNSGAGTFTAIASTMSSSRWQPEAAYLISDKVLVAGGRDSGGVLTTADLYDPVANTFAPSNHSMSVGRANASVIPLPNGMVLLAGGAIPASAAAELYDVDSDRFDATGSLLQSDNGVIATLLNNGQVLVAGLTSGSVSDAELYSPSFNPLGTIGVNSSEATDSITGTCVLVPITATTSTCTATVTPVNVATSPHTITATYPADAVYSSSSNTASLTVTKADTSTTIANPVNPSVLGQSVTFTATVSPVSPGAGTPTGTVTFLDGSSPIGSSTLNGGVATFTTSNLTIGSHTITTSYGGDGNFNLSNGSLIGNPQVVSGNPAPMLTSIAPISITAGGFAFTLTLTGSNFVSNSVVNWNGSALTTTFVSGASLTAAVPASDIAATGTAVVTVFNPTPGGGTSSTQTFTIIANPVPTLSSIAPASGTAGGSSFTLTLTGTNFVSTSVVEWNGTPLTTVFVSGTSITATVPASDIATSGTATVTVVNPTPGGGTSSSQTFTTNNPAPSLSSIAPSSATTGGATFTLTLTGTNFISGSTVNWNGTALTTSFVSTVSLTATVPASDIAAGGTAAVTVFNPTPGGGTSSAQTFTINNPVPTLTLTASPSPATFGVSVTLTGTVAPAPTGSPLGTVTFLNGSTSLGTATPNSSGVATFTLTTLPAGVLSLTASYSGNATLASGASAPTALTVNTTYEVMAAQTPYDVPEGGSVVIPVSVPPLGGAYNSVVSLSARGLPPGATGTFTPAQVTPGASGGSTTLSIQLAPLAARIPNGGPTPLTPIPLLAAGSGLLIFIRRKRLVGALRFAAVCLALVIFGSAMLGCNGGFLRPPSTPPGNFTVSIIGTSGSTNQSTTVTVVVQ